MPHVICPQVIHPDAQAMIRATPGFTLEILPDRSPATLAARLPDADALILRTIRVDHAFLALCPKLRILARHGVGYDIIDVPALTERGIPLTITPEANAVSVAEHALMLMLACMRKLPGYDANIRRLVWGGQADLPSFELAGKSVLVVGFGRIGTRVARLCAAFGMRVLVRDPNVAKGTIRGAGYEPVDDLDAAAGQADIVTLHCPSNADTRGMVDARFLAAMKRGAVLVNTARGTLTDQLAVEAALRSGQLVAAGLDVFEEEPIEAELSLFSAPNLIMTPHVAASTQEGLRRMALESAAAVIACFEGRLDRDVVVNPEVLGRNA
ncbi:NAD(P)-dependent oxidoreductase [Falsiroseomonas oryzae]|uniref:NAD(P)-dependent oxidoreductase n=1 Tax=Falsiroseomonas oryzae TaxID=2766473 RepID=UPI0022EB8F63|nr:hydroxyacid dehydrogenase [Roseomonas sp. MO-31]